MPKSFYEQACHDNRSIHLATLDKDSRPHASYAPFVVDEKGSFYINISGMARHAPNLHANPRASVALIEDESRCENIFARKRITFDCDAELIVRESDAWRETMERFEARFGEIIQGFHQMEDFRIFKLIPCQGLAVLGFGKAYRFSGAKPTDEQLMGAGGSQNPHMKDTLKKG